MRSLLVACALFLSACSGKNVVFIVDTSGSMHENESGLIKDVKKSIKKILLDYESGDRVYLFTFDEKVTHQLTLEISSNEDLKVLYDKLDAIEAKGQWTDLVAALDHSIKAVVDLNEENPSKTKMVLYTDGKHDPAPYSKNARKKVNFGHLFKKYYSNYQQKKSWFIYYVELDEPDPALQKFLDKTQSGKVITKEEFKKETNFTLDTPIPLWMILAGAGGGLVFLVVILYLLPWFKGVVLIPVSARSPLMGGGPPINLSLFGRKLLRRTLKIGAEGDVKVKGIGVKAEHADVGIDFRGRMYIKPASEKAAVKVNGRTIKGKRFVEFHEEIQIGDKTFVLDQDKLDDKD